MSSTALNIVLSSKHSEEADGKHRIKIWVSEAVNITPDIFLFDTFPPDPNPAINEAGTFFWRVCIYADLLNSVPRALSYSPFLRGRSIDATFDTEADCADFYAEVQAGVQALLDELRDICAQPARFTHTTAYTGGYSLTQNTRISPAGTCEVTLSIANTNPALDCGFFLIENTSGSTMTADNQDGELVRICTPADMLSYPLGAANEDEDGFFRDTELVFAVETKARLDAFLPNMLADIKLWAERYADGTVVGTDIDASSAYDGTLYGTVEPA